ncbi:CopD family protein [Hydrogenophaga laconesensis]|uniref:Protoporphyrinogen IX oxidase n=1 Tax=Hydrogenophaga laconesensis TaxID=1805971 RepID=A0ABU1V7Z6_9BURK|nr:CopD family protein [Hydrogenophaga laconesensis]MDR7093458.1 putative membrane protein [Hydrogenophaga laconesensis]
MPWLKLLHISAVIVWCGALLYLPLMLSSAAAASRPPAAALQKHWPRQVFIGLATPAALLAIGSGTLIFALHGPVAPWLMFKLAGVGLLVLGHGACGLLVLRIERGEPGGVRWVSRVVMFQLLLCLLGIAWLVLRKPA